MSNISNAFSGGKAFIAFLTAGDPNFEKTVEYVKTMAEAGADLVELGIPFSDPIADGPVIQSANLRAFKSGTTTQKVFDMVREIRKDCDVPLAFLTYLNPVFKYGYEAFFKECSSCGVDGLILPDLPFEEKEEAASVARKYGVDIISLIAPTSEERIKMIAENAEGFLYVVSSMGVTGVRSEITTNLKSEILKIKSYTDVPAAVGFGISTPEQAHEMCSFADGAIVGSAIVKIIEEHGENAAEYLAEYVKSMKAAVNSKSF